MDRNVIVLYNSWTGFTRNYAQLMAQALDCPALPLSEAPADLSGYDFINGFSTSILDQVSIDGGIYLLPTSNAIYGVYYNKTLMDEYGWQMPSNIGEL